MAAGEAAFHGGSTAPIKDAVKVKALDGDGASTKDGGGKPKGNIKIPMESRHNKNVRSDPKNIKGDSKQADTDKPVCCYFLSNGGPKKGQKCSFHEWMRRNKVAVGVAPDCPVKEVPKVKKENGENGKSKEVVTKSEEGSSSMAAEASGAVFSPLTLQPSEDLMKEAVQLLKSLRPSVKMIGVCQSLKVIAELGAHQTLFENPSRVAEAVKTRECLIGAPRWNFTMGYGDSAS